MGEEVIKEAEDTMSILSHNTDDCTVSSKQKFYKDRYQGRFEGFIWLGGGSLEFIKFLIICVCTLPTDGRFGERNP